MLGIYASIALQHVEAVRGSLRKFKWGRAAYIYARDKINGLFGYEFGCVLLAQIFVVDDWRYGIELHGIYSIDLERSNKIHFLNERLQPQLHNSN